MQGRGKNRSRNIFQTTRERRATYKPAPASRARFKRVTRKQIDAVVQRIVQEFNPEKVILFGSYAYGKPNADSDVDLLVVMESDERPARRTARVLGAILDVKTFPMDLLVRTPQELEHRLAIGDFFVQEVIGRGKVLYARRVA
jgi:predicted nucleotidyltransferase